MTIVFNVLFHFRPPGIYREQYITALFTYYNSKIPQTPITPTWCPKEEKRHIRNK